MSYNNIKDASIIMLLLRMQRIFVRTGVLQRGHRRYRRNHTLEKDTQPGTLPYNVISACHTIIIYRTYPNRRMVLTVVCLCARSVIRVSP